MENYRYKLESAKIDVAVDEALRAIQALEVLVNRQTDTVQRHADQALIHVADLALRDIYSKSP